MDNAQPPVHCVRPDDGLIARGKALLNRRLAGRSKNKKGSSVQHVVYNTSDAIQAAGNYSMATFERLTSDGRRKHREQEILAPTPVVDQSRGDPTDAGISDFADLSLGGIEEEARADEAKKAPARRYTQSVRILFLSIFA